MARKPKHQTNIQFLTRVRETYRTSKQLETCRLAYVLLKYLADNDYTVQEMRSAWDMNPPQWTAQAALLKLKADKYTAYLTALNSTNNEAGN